MDNQCIACYEAMMAILIWMGQAQKAMILFKQMIAETAKIQMVLQATLRKKNLIDLSQ